MMLSQSLPAPEHFSSIGWVIVVIVALAAGINQVWDMVNKGRGLPDEPPNGQLNQSIRQLNARMKILEEWRGDLTSKMESDKNQILIAGEHRAEKLHERINEVLIAVSKTQGKVEEMSKHCPGCKDHDHSNA
jgi:hypothetical protein